MQTEPGSILRQCVRALLWLWLAVTVLHLVRDASGLLWLAASVGVVGALVWAATGAAVRHLLRR